MKDLNNENYKTLKEEIEEDTRRWTSHNHEPAQLVL
jgi:hypothetical protein